MSFYAPAIAHLWETAPYLGLDPMDQFRRANVDPAIRLDISARVPERKVDRLVDQMARESGDETFVFTTAEYLQPGYFGALGYAWLSSPSLRKAFERLERFVHMANDRIELKVGDSGSEFLVDMLHHDDNYLNPLLREQARFVPPIWLSRQTLGQDFSPAWVSFQHPEPADASGYENFFRCELKFDQPATVIALTTEMADRPLPAFNPEIVAQFDQMIVDYLARLDRNNIVGRTRAIILEQLPSGEISLEEAAGQMAMSSRTLTRRLADSDETFTGLVNSTRRELGEKYILNRSLTLTEISFLLGFSEVSSFSRAWKNWTGRSPRQHRDELFTD